MTGSFWRFTLLIALKDLRIEGRSREILYTMGFSAALVVRSGMAAGTLLGVAAHRL